MELWMLVTLVGVFGGALGWGVYLWIQNFKEQMESDDFFLEAESRYGYKIVEPVQSIQQYEEQKALIWKHAQAQFGLPDSAFYPADGDPNNSWMRRLPKEAIKRLQGLLMHRAIANIPRYMVMQKDGRSKLILLSKQMISERQWLLLNEAQEDLTREIHAVRLEADCLADGWGRDGAIFQEAMHIQKEIQMRQERERAMQEQAKAASGGSSPEAVADIPNSVNVVPEPAVPTPPVAITEIPPKVTAPRPKNAPGLRKKSSGSKEDGKLVEAQNTDPAALEEQRKIAEREINALLEEEEREKLRKLDQNAKKRVAPKSKKSLKKA